MSEISLIRPERGDWRVLRNCCETGRCIGCRMHGRPARIVQASCCSEEWAQHVAARWKTYEATAEPMPARSRKA